MGRKRGRGARLGDHKLFCIRGHICMASDAVRLWNQQWVCLEHYETRPPLDFLSTKTDGQIDVPWGRGQDKVADRSFDGTSVDGSDIGIEESTYNVPQVDVEQGTFEMNEESGPLPEEPVLVEGGDTIVLGPVFP